MPLDVLPWSWLRIPFALGLSSGPWSSWWTTYIYWLFFPRQLVEHANWFCAKSQFAHNIGNKTHYDGEILCVRLFVDGDFYFVRRHKPSFSHSHFSHESMKFARGLVARGAAVRMRTGNAARLCKIMSCSFELDEYGVSVLHTIGNASFYRCVMVAQQPFKMSS